AGALLARRASMVLRVALIYYLLDPPSTGESRGIAPVHLDAAMAVWNYCEESVQMLFKTRSGTMLGDKVLALLAGGPMTKDTMNDHLSPKQKGRSMRCWRAWNRPGRGSGRPARPATRRPEVKAEVETDQQGLQPAPADLERKRPLLKWRRGERPHSSHPFTTRLRLANKRCAAGVSLMSRKSRRAKRKA